MTIIQKNQQGGSFSSFFVDYKPFTGISAPAAAAATPAKESSSDKSDSDKDNKVGLKDLLSLAKELKGLPADQELVLQQISKLYHHAALFGEGSLNTSEVITSYLTALRGIRLAEFNAQEYEDAKKQVIAQNGYSEYAVDSEGHVFVQDQETGDIQPITPEELKSLDGNYQILTNANLLYYRANNPQLAFNNEILNIVHNGIGIEAITKHLLSVTSKIGANTLRSAGYSEKSAEDISKGVEALEEAANQGQTVTNLYTQGVMSKDQVQQANLALTYLWNTLPTNAKTLLKVKGGSEEGAQQLLQSLVFSGLDYERTVPHPDKEKKDKEKKDKDEASGLEITEAIGFYLGLGAEKKIQIIPNTMYAFDLTVRSGVLKTDSGNAKEYDTLADVDAGSFSGLLDISNATFGGVQISTLSKVFLKNAEIYNVELPFDVKYFQETHILRPDINLAQKMADLDVAIQNGEVDKDDIDEVNAKCEDLDLPPMYVSLDENGHPVLNPNAYARFARVSALVDETSLRNKDEVQSWAKIEASKTERENFTQHMKGVDKNYKLGGGWSPTKLYDGVVFIPLNRDILSATYGGGKYYRLPKMDGITAAQKDADNRALNSYNTPPTLSSLQGK